MSVHGIPAARSPNASRSSSSIWATPGCPRRRSPRSITSPCACCTSCSRSRAGLWRGGSGHGAGGVRIVTLDNLVPGKWYSHLGTGQLRWAAAVLTSEQPSILAFHHPPVDLGVEIQQRVGLGDRGKRH